MKLFLDSIKNFNQYGYETNKNEFKCIIPINKFEIILEFIGDEKCKENYVKLKKIEKENIKNKKHTCTREVFNEFVNYFKKEEDLRRLRKKFYYKNNVDGKLLKKMLLKKKKCGEYKLINGDEKDFNGTLMGKCIYLRAYTDKVTLYFRWYESGSYLGYKFKEK